MKRTLIALSLLGWLAGPLVAQVGMTVEQNSGVAFPMAISGVGSGASQALTGMGIRTKTFLKVKVYAFGIYVDEAGAEAALSDWVGKTYLDLQSDQGFYDRILQMDFPITLRLVMTRDVGGEDMAEAFDGALRPRVQRAAAEMNMPGGEQALEQFRGYFSVEEMTNGSELLFTCANGTLSTSVKGEVQTPIDSPALCWALFDVYLGRNPISKDGKRTVVMMFPDVLRGP
ncbi:MAG: chalcone isomerase family protein [Gemmatimonadota bacterium]|nr:MAG: chalcone isomerase family protein [Gemmatimonadota bacterium]